MTSVYDDPAQANSYRLPPLPPYHPGLISPHHPTPHPLEHTDGELDAHLASNTNSD